MSLSKKNVIEILNSYALTHSDIHLEKTHKFVIENENLFGRDNLKGHITGSAWVIDPSQTKALLIHHKKLKMWFQPGGHVDTTDHSVLHAAQREAIEETGSEKIIPLHQDLFDLDVHLIPERKGIPAHWHYDFRFIFKAASESITANFTEVNDIKWIDLNELIQNEKYASVKRMAEKTLNK